MELKQHQLDVFYVVMASFPFWVKRANVVQRICILYPELVNVLLVVQDSNQIRTKTIVTRAQVDSSQRMMESV